MEKTLSDGLNEFAINLANLSIGIYVVELNTVSEKKVLKIKR